MIGIWISVGIIIGFILTVIVYGLILPVLGTIEVDESDPANVKWRFVLTKDVDFSKHKYIILKVDNKTDLSHK